MKIKFYGGTCSVTGSCHYLEVNDLKILLDCGLYQGQDDEGDKNHEFPFDPKDIDYVILSHAHIDHCGRIPLLYKRGFKGKTLCTNGTKDLCKIILGDCATIEEHGVKIKNNYEKDKRGKPVEPLYTINDVEKALENFKGYDYDVNIPLKENLYIIFRDGGHLLGSAITEIYEEQGKPKLVYSGDLGNIGTPIIKDPKKITIGQCVIMESTYGSKNHEKKEEYDALIDIVNSILKKGGNVVIPSFSVGRTQEIIYILNKHVESEKIKTKVYIDSPLAQEATKIFIKYKEYYDREANKLLKEGDDPLKFKNLIFTKNVDESKKINQDKGVIIIASSGMCEGGRIKYHLLNNIEKENSAIIFVGYQAKGTLGRKILEGYKEIKIFGENKIVKCNIYKISGLSGHADKDGLMNWVKSFENMPQAIYLVHGEEEEKESLKKALKEKGVNCIIPKEGEEVFL